MFKLLVVQVMRCGRLFKNKPYQVGTVCVSEWFHGEGSGLRGSVRGSVCG